MHDRHHQLFWTAIPPLGQPSSRLKSVTFCYVQYAAHLTNVGLSQDQLQSLQLVWLRELQYNIKQMGMHIH